jgi:hypothetical protein
MPVQLSVCKNRDMTVFASCSPNDSLSTLLRFLQSSGVCKVLSASFDTPWDPTEGSTGDGISAVLAGVAGLDLTIKCTTVSFEIVYSANDFVSFKTLPLTNSRCCLMGMDRCCEIRSFKVAMVSVGCKLKISNWDAGFNVLTVTLIADCAAFVVDSDMSHKTQLVFFFISSTIYRKLLTTSRCILINSWFLNWRYTRHLWRLSLICYILLVSFQVSFLDGNDANPVTLRSFLWANA